MNVMAMVNEGGPETATTTLREHLSSTLVSIGTYEQVEISAVSGARLDVVALSHYGPAQEMLVAFRYFDRSVTEPWSIGSIGDAIRVAMAEVREI
ncbi:hypothetical protein HYV30_01545 [Candidatus Kaiserbacteria bacterium]|nr:hypothetical protein [Candidatus Kaiserbacteria bacterium]